jgi:hypothetical protein
MSGLPTVSHYVALRNFTYEPSVTIAVDDRNAAHRTTLTLQLNLLSEMQLEAAAIRSFAFSSSDGHESWADARFSDARDLDDSSPREKAARDVAERSCRTTVLFGRRNCGCAT